MMGQRRRRWPNNKPQLGKRLVFTEAYNTYVDLSQHAGNIGNMLCTWQIEAFVGAAKQLRITGRAALCITGGVYL